MTQQEGAILSAYTGRFLCKDFSIYHKYVEDLMGRPVFSHEMAEDEFSAKLKKLSKGDFTKVMEAQS